VLKHEDLANICSRSGRVDNVATENIKN